MYCNVPFQYLSPNYLYHYLCSDVQHTEMLGYLRQFWLDNAGVCHLFESCTMSLHLIYSIIVTRFVILLQPRVDRFSSLDLFPRSLTLWAPWSGSTR
jgi:hypothetical protein